MLAKVVVVVVVVCTLVAAKDPTTVKVNLGDQPSTARLSGPVAVSLGLPLPPAVTVRVTDPPAPVCTGKFCLVDADYPLDKVNAIIDRYYNSLQQLYQDLYRFPQTDLMYHDNRTHVYRHGGTFVCESTVKYVRPGWARNVRGEWRAVINTHRYPQTLRVEECKYQEKRCEYLPPCYKSKCVQRWSYSRLLSVDPHRPDHQPTVDVFEVPSACACFVQDFVYY